jgi:hypothetical protein
MAAEDIIVDQAALLTFARHLQPRIDEANSALTMLTTTPGTDPPALGSFYDAQLTTGRHQTLHDQYVQRLRRLVNALTAAATATGTIIEKYHEVADHDEVKVNEIQTALLPVSKALDGIRSHA